MNYRFAIALTIGLFTCATVSAADRAERPNIVLVLADDLGWSDLVC